MTGEVIEINENNAIIKCEELNDYISYEDDLCDYYIYSDQFMELQVGEEIQGICVSPVQNEVWSKDELAG